MFGMGMGRMGLTRLGRGGGAAPTLIANPRIAMIGDSLTQYTNFMVALSGVVLSRDAAGVVSVPKSGHAIFGSQPISIVNAADTSYETFAQSTYIDANNFSYPTGVAGAAGTSTGMSLTQAIVQNRYQRIGYWSWLQGLFNGGLRFVANYGQGGDQLSDMGTAVSLAAASAADIVIMSGGINDIHGFSASAATVISRMQGHVNTLIAAGKKVVILGITPLGSTFNSATKGQAIVEANTGYAAIAAANPDNVKFASAHADLTDGTNNWQAYSWAVRDGIHWGMRAASVVATRIASAISALATSSSLLPISSSDAPTFDGFTCIKQYGAWDATGGGYAGIGYTPAGANSGVAPRLDIFSSNADTVWTPSLVDRGDGTGFWQQVVVTPGGTNRDLTFYLESSSGETLASLGLAAGDELMTVAELEVSGGAAANFLSFTAETRSQSSGLYGIANDASGSTTLATNPDAVSTVVLTGRVKVSASWTSVLQTIACRFSAASASPCTIKVGRIALYRKPA